jgi:hypothetical protein
MSETALELITRSYYLSQVVSRELQVPSANQISDGLILLNALLDVKGSDIRLIPYFTETVFNTVAGQEVYNIPNLLSIESLTFNLGVVRYQMQEQARREYFGTGRVDNIQSLPFSWHLERTLDGSKVYLYYVPNAEYVMKAWGKVALTDVTLQTDLATVYDSYYREYLRFALAEYLCMENSQNMPELAAKKFAEIRKKLMDISPPDLRIRKRGTLGERDVYNWAYVNIPGWSPI